MLWIIKVWKYEKYVYHNHYDPVYGGIIPGAWVCLCIGLTDQVMNVSAYSDELDVMHSVPMVTVAKAYDDPPRWYYCNPHSPPITSSRK
jgi:hypothetical protein